MRKIDDNIGFHAAIGRIRIDRVARMAFGIDVETGDNGAVASFGGAGGDDMPHSAVAAAENQSNHRGTSFLLQLRVPRHRGLTS